MLTVLLSKGRAWASPSCAWKINCLQAGVAAGLNPPLKWLAELRLCNREKMRLDVNSIASPLGQIHPIPFEQIWRRGCRNTVDEPEDNFVHVFDSTLPRLIATLIYKRNQNRYVT